MKYIVADVFLLLEVDFLMAAVDRGAPGFSNVVAHASNANMQLRC